MSYISHKINTVKGRYLSPVALSDTLNRWSLFKDLTLMSHSVLGENIEVYRLGSGKQTILLWSQMHGNESTTTKGLIDFMSFLLSDSKEALAILKQLHFVIVPILNPDGAKAYTRVNANSVDLNRDFKDLSQPESQFLVHVFKRVKPHFCFNLHDQRTIFSVGNTKAPATLSFLGPAADKEKTITPSRMVSMQLIVAINNHIQSIIPGQVGRYDDHFNANCAGDHFQSKKVPTLLFEAGHYPADYEREHTRRFIYEALLAAAQSIVTKTYVKHSVSDYLLIPENQKTYLDLRVINAHLINPKISSQTSLAFQYEEVLENGSIVFIPKIISIEDEKEHYFHNLIDLSLPNTEGQELVFQNIAQIIKDLRI
ncbi:MAG: M14 family metallopeptidase [Flavobacteriaceae bacterium]|tara:strand:+ start:103151 stop:104257 length:1107 start_codon:yes stop_codon:yes gene_type:complete